MSKHGEEIVTLVNEDEEQSPILEVKKNHKDKKHKKGHGHGHGHKHSHSHKHEEQEGCCDPKAFSFVSIGVLSLLYVIAELGVAIYLKSLVLLSDGFHNLSDVVSLYIAYWAQQASKRDSSHDMSYGWRRTEILGGLTNGCFLLSLCLYVVLESIPKFIEPQPIEGGLIFMITAGVGLAVNTIGTIVFCITGQGHGHSHSHGHGHGHGHGHKDKKKEFDGLVEVDIQQHSFKDEKTKVKKKKKNRDMNVHAVFLHFLGDAISSLMVLGAGALIHFFKGKWTYYIDPVSSLLIIIIILWTTIPLVKRCSMILLQSSPTDIDVEAVRLQILRVPGIVSVHDFHVWQLVDGLVVTSVHIGVEEDSSNFTQIVNQVRSILHEYGIHSSSIQPEFVPKHKTLDFCEQNCVQECDEDWCCKKTAERKRKNIAEFAISTEL